MSNDPKDATIDFTKLAGFKTQEKSCHTCIKEDVCSFKEKLNEVHLKIQPINYECAEIFSVDVICNKWAGQQNIFASR